MKVRDGNIIVCDCGAELNPEIITPGDFIVYTNGMATCSNCGASEAVELSQDKVCLTCGQAIT